MVKKIVIGASVLILIVAAYGFYLFNKPSEHIVASKSELTITSKDLIKKFESQPNLIKEHLNKVIEVNGVITLIEKGTVNTSLVIDNGIKCELSNDQITKEIITGKQATVKGVFNGVDEMFNEIILAKCRLIK